MNIKVILISLTKQLTMKIEIISFETAKKAKKCGFKFSNIMFGGYHKNGKFSYNAELGMTDETGYNDPNDSIDAYPQSLLQRWLREEHNICVSVYINKSKIHGIYYNFGIYDLLLSIEELKPQNQPLRLTRYYSYEEALEQGLLEALNMLK